MQRKMRLRQFGNQDINDILMAFTLFTKLAHPSETQKSRRRWAHLINRDFGFWLYCKSLKAAMNDEFWATNLTSLRHLYKNICPKMKRHYLYEIPAQEKFKELKQKYQIGKKL